MYLISQHLIFPDSIEFLIINDYLTLFNLVWNSIKQCIQPKWEIELKYIKDWCEYYNQLCNPFEYVTVRLLQLGSSQDFYRDYRKEYKER